MVKKRAKKRTGALSNANGSARQKKVQKHLIQPKVNNFLYKNDNVTLTSNIEEKSNDEFNTLIRENTESLRNNSTSDEIRVLEPDIKMSENSNVNRKIKEKSYPLITVSTNGAQQSSLKRIKDPEKRAHEITDPDQLTLWHHPITTLNYFIRELLIDCVSFARKTLQYRKTVFLTVLFVTSFILLGRLSGPQQQTFKTWEAQVKWWLYWIGLGVLSSVGLGTGLHTFVLYLGPHIAAVTMAAYECGSLNFPEPPYPDQIICPTVSDTLNTVGILTIMRKVRVEAMMWGAGTALGELPPYFMARAARTSGKTTKDQECDQEELKELEALEALENGGNISFLMRAKLAMKHFVQKAGFWGILACASIPNPLFDLAGLTCGHYLIPFWTFFGATLIGKAIVKMHIQQLAVIIAFNEELLDKAISFLVYIPVVGVKFQEPLKKYLVEQKRKLHDKSSTEHSTTISWLFDKFVMLMVVYFLVTIIHALARNHHRRRTKSSTD